MSVDSTYIAPGAKHNAGIAGTSLSILLRVRRGHGQASRNTQRACNHRSLECTEPKRFLEAKRKKTLAGKSQPSITFWLWVDWACQQAAKRLIRAPVKQARMGECGTVLVVGRSKTHTFSKIAEESIYLQEGLGVEGDAHNGKTVQHLSRMKIKPLPANLRQVHLIHSELFQELKEAGFTVQPLQLGENITTQGVDLLSLPTGTRLHLGQQAVVEVTGLRNPCPQIENFQPGLLEKMTSRTPEGKLIRKSGVMGVVLAAGCVRSGDQIQVHLPPEPHCCLRVV